MYFDLRQRPLFAALCLSFALHLIVLFGAGWSRQRSAASAAALPPLQVVVRGEAVREPQAPSTVPATPAPPVRSEVLRRPSVAVRPQAVRSEAPSPAAAAVPAVPVALAAPAVASSDARPAEGPLDVPAAAGGGISADGLRQYRIDLAGAARRFRGYPALARARGWEGVAEVTVGVAAGAASTVRVTRSSGHAVLDEQALSMLERAVAQTPLPENLRGRAFTVLLPIRFSLEE